VRYTYYRWDGSQDSPLDADEVIEALSDDLMSDGDLWNAFQRLNRWGLNRPGQPSATGLQSLQQQLRAVRQALLDRYDLTSFLDDIRSKLDEVVHQELTGIDRRLADTDPADERRGALEKIAQRRREQLAALPETPAGAIEALRDYDFLDPGARERFDEMVREIQRRVLDQFAGQVEDTLREMTPEVMAQTREMLRDLSATVRAAAAGDESRFGDFMQKHGAAFPGTSSVSDLIGQLQAGAQRFQSLLDSLPPDARDSLQALLGATLGDPLRAEIEELRDALASAGAIAPVAHSFGGDRTVTLDEALGLMDRLQDLDALERDLKRAQDSGTLDDLSEETVGATLGKEAMRSVEHLKGLARVLEEAGYIEKKDGEYELTARGVRRIGQKALEDIFSGLSRDAFGNHSVDVPGPGADRSDSTKAYEFGDPFLLDLNATLQNAVVRSGAGTPIDLGLGDFEVYRTEAVAEASTVLMLDMSRSMPLRGCFVAAKKVALALSSLISSQFPRDNFYIIGFSDYAREINPEALYRITWGDYVYGTNMQHGFALARRLLARHKSGNKQIILITDGEPTAHIEGGRVHFSYPPTFRTFQETLREVKRCTRDRIVINTFMLERSHYLTEFVTQITRVNHGRAFFATPERLGDYILVDYVKNRVS